MTMKNKPLKDVSPTKQFSGEIDSNDSCHHVIFWIAKIEANPINGSHDICFGGWIYLYFKRRANVLHTKKIHQRHRVS